MYSISWNFGSIFFFVLFKKPYFALDQCMYSTYEQTENLISDSPVFLYDFWIDDMNTGTSASLCTSICRNYITLAVWDCIFSVLFNGYEEVLYIL